MNPLALLHDLLPCPHKAERAAAMAAYGDEAVMHLHTREELREAHRTITLLGRELLQYEARLAIKEGR